MKFRWVLLAVQLLVLAFTFWLQTITDKHRKEAAQTYLDATAMYKKATYLFQHSCASDNLASR
jgi:lipopolysaccharide export system protein LptC